MQFDPTISIGAILNLVGVIGTGFIVLVGLHWRLRTVEDRLDSMGTVLVTLARQDERLRHFEQALDDMKHGRGFVFEQPFGGGAMNK